MDSRTPLATRQTGSGQDVLPVGMPEATDHARLTHVCLICGRHDDQGSSPTGRAAWSHGLDHEGNGACVAEYKRRYCGK